MAFARSIPLIWEFKRRSPARKSTNPSTPITRWLLIGVFTVYGAFYLVHTMAPEVQPDAVYYHLGLVSEYFRIGGFPDRIDFYEILPQGMETLFLFAFAFGAHSAAKIVHFAFLVATPPILVAVGRRLGIQDRVSWIAAAIYVCAPVVGVSATCTYTDGGLVCATLAAAYFLLVWRDEGKARYLIPAGLLCGFCYSIKVSAILWPALAALFVLIERRRDWRSAISNAAVACRFRAGGGRAVDDPQRRVDWQSARAAIQRVVPESILPRSDRQSAGSLYAHL